VTLSRTTPCNQIHILKPRWKQRVVGIANYKIGNHNAIDILATDKEGKRYYPYTLYASGETIENCETQYLDNGTLLYLVPISILETLERE